MVFNLNEPPGFSTVIESHESEVCYGGRRGYTQVSERAIVVGSDAEDSGNDPTTSLRGGLIMIEDSNGVYYPFGQTGKTGPIRGILPFTLDMAIHGIVAEKWTKVFTSGLLKTNEVLNAGRAEFNALTRMGFILDEPLSGDPFSRSFKETIQVDDEDYTATNYDFSSLIVVNNPDSTRTITLPAIDEGGYVAFIFGAAGGTVQSLEGGNMVAGGAITADDIDFSGLIMIEISVITIDTTLAWIVIGGGESVFV